MSTIAYDFPHRLRGWDRARRELRRIERAQGITFHRGDTAAYAYLTRRHERATKALAVMRQQRT